MYTQYKLLDLLEGKEKMPEAAELKGAWMKRSFDAYMLMVQASWSALAINLNSQQPQWSVDYIRARILEEDLRRRSVERSEEGAGYGVGGGKSGFKKKWKGKNKDNPKEDGGGGQGEVCFYCKKRRHRWRKCYQRPNDWTPPSSGNQRGGTRSGGVMGASGEEKDEEKGGKSELHLEDLPGSELSSDHSGGGEQQGAGSAAEEGLADESARVDSPSQPEPAANAKVTKRSVQRGASPHGQQIATREKRVAAAPSRLKYSRLGGPKQCAMAIQTDEGEDEEMAFCFFTPWPELCNGPLWSSWRWQSAWCATLDQRHLLVFSFQLAAS
ncbi:unnamed protein product [Closterium sp. NIES-65]|nr:unnamed protein product [Closterium sp. NIES-65]